MVGVNVAGRPGGAVSLGVGMASIFSALPGMKGLMSYWYQFALVFEAVFILTTIDTGTRVARFLLQETFGTFYAPFKNFNWLPGTLITSFLVVFSWGWFVSTGSIATIWPMFGLANQLLGVLALAVGTTILIKMGKKRYIWTTFGPMCFMIIVNFTAAYQLFFGFLSKAETAATSQALFAFRFNAALVVLVSSLAIIILCDSAMKWYGYLFLRRPYTTTEVEPDVYQAPTDLNC